MIKILKFVICMGIGLGIALWLYPKLLIYLVIYWGWPIMLPLLIWLPIAVALVGMGAVIADKI